MWWITAHTTSKWKTVCQWFTVFFSKSPQCGCEICSFCASPYRWTPGRPTTPGGRVASWRVGSWRRRSLWGEPARWPGEESGRLQEESSVRWVRSGVTLWRLQEVDSAAAVKILTFNLSCIFQIKCEYGCWASDTLLTLSIFFFYFLRSEHDCFWTIFLYLNSAWLIAPSSKPLPHQWQF